MKTPRIVPTSVKIPAPPLAKCQPALPRVKFPHVLPHVLLFAVSQCAVSLFDVIAAVGSGDVTVVVELAACLLIMATTMVAPATTMAGTTATTATTETTVTAMETMVTTPTIMPRDMETFPTVPTTAITVDAPVDMTE